MADVKLERTIAALPPDLREEVGNFAAFLLSKRKGGKNTATGETHPLARLAGVWRDEPLADKDLLPERSLGRDVDL